LHINFKCDTTIKLQSTKQGHDVSNSVFYIYARIGKICNNLSVTSQFQASVYWP